MTLPFWPEELDRPMRQGFEQAKGDGRLRTPVDTGPTRTRLRYSSVPDVITLTLDCDADQKARTDHFIAYDLGEGSEPFAMADLILDGLLLADTAGNIITDSDDNPIAIDATWVCVIAEKPVWTPVGVRWRGRLSISVMP